ncbi:hypothetical protein K491DRAFT_674031 [Lophiostoma macrostomum CBS 122681]|uniref:Uncharacterized protein n=1 Tax=Lophiostoma macrostomum CBS 122681 TaxID=1314788 RepID=A0A6A6TMS5_9PLEO|nr:hypothetical protein K491DRAFT_674031 [Lophiostoma macrostomum CBS 122681]
MPKRARSPSPPAIEPPQLWPNDCAPPLELLHAFDSAISDHKLDSADEVSTLPPLAYSSPLNKINHHAPTRPNSRPPSPERTQAPGMILTPDGFRPRTKTQSTLALTTTTVTAITPTPTPTTTPSLPNRCLTSLSTLLSSLCTCLATPLRPLSRSLHRRRKTPLDDADGPLAAMMHRNDSLLDGPHSEAAAAESSVTRLGIGSQQCSPVGAHRSSTRFREVRPTPSGWQSSRVGGAQGQGQGQGGWMWWAEEPYRYQVW